MVNSNLLVGVLGNGEIPKKTVVALVADRVSEVNAHFLIPATVEHFTPAVAAVAAWAAKHDHPYEVIIDGTEDEIEGIADVLNGALVTHKVTAVEAKLVALLVAGRGDDTDAILMLAWDEGDDACQLAATPHAAASIC